MAVIEHLALTKGKPMTTTDARTLARTTDEALFPIEGRIQAAEESIFQSQKTLRRATMTENGKAHYQKRIAQAEESIRALNHQAQPLRDIFAAHQWNRFIVVPGGHLHRGNGCSTLRTTTVRYLVADYSGADEAEIVDLAGERACTVCFPTAPVDQPSRLPEDVARREAATKEREAKESKLKAEAHKFLFDDRSTLDIGYDHLKTVRAAENFISRNIESAISSLTHEPVDESHRQKLIGNATGYFEGVRLAALAIQDRAAQFGESKPADELIAKKFAAKRKQFVKGGWTAQELPSLDRLLELA